MIFDSINLVTELEKSELTENRIIADVLKIFESNKSTESEIIRKLNNTMSSEFNFIEFDSPDSKCVFSIESIEKLSIKFRLRFLESKFFKSDFPIESLLKIKLLEKRYGIEFCQFYLLAPKEVFKLTDVNADPLLFAKLNDEKFLLIHQWGNDLEWYRAILCFPFRGILQFLISILFLAFFVQLCIPTSWMSVGTDREMMMRLWLTTHCFIGFFAFSIFLGSLSFTSFSGSVWRSNFFN